MKGLHVTLSINNTNALPLCLVSHFTYFYAEPVDPANAECYYAEYCYDECYFTECCYDECCYAECDYAKCRGAEKRSSLFVKSVSDDSKKIYNIDTRC
jgi:hypothetical protein